MATSQVKCLLTKMQILQFNNFVTKLFQYVLSVLHFTYPTLFQEWQTAVGAVVLYGLASQGYYKISYDRLVLK